MAFDIYKRGQGLYTRLWSALGAGLIVIVGCWRLYETLGAVEITNQNTLILVQTLVPAAVAIIFGLFIFWLVNKPALADFMISAEGELKKVNWSSKKEIYASTVIVIVVVIIMSLMLAFTDIFFQFFFRELGLYS